MRSLLSAGAALLMAVTTASAAQLPGPHPDSENNWPWISDQTAAPQAAAPAAQHYVWQEGYDRGGKWHGHWVIVH